MEYSARFSKASYDMVKSGNKSNRISNINKSIEDTGFYADPKLSNRDILYLKNDKTKQVHLAHRGTDTSGKKTGTDIRQDISFALGQSAHDKNTQKNINRTKNLVKGAPSDYTVSMSGHSLGNVAPTEALKHSSSLRKRVSSYDSFNGAHSPFTNKAPSKAVKKELDKREKFALKFELLKLERYLGGMGLMPPCSTYHRFAVGMTGDKMSSSKPETTIFMDDSIAEMSKKLEENNY